MPHTIDPVIIDVDATELECDLVAIRDGALRPPTVSAVRLRVAGGREWLEDVPIYIGGEEC